MGQAAGLGDSERVIRLARAMARVQQQEMASMNAARATLGLATVTTDPPATH